MSAKQTMADIDYDSANVVYAEDGLRIRPVQLMIMPWLKK